MQRKIIYLKSQGKRVLLICFLLLFIPFVTLFFIAGYKSSKLRQQSYLDLAKEFNNQVDTNLSQIFNSIHRISYIHTQDYKVEKILAQTSEHKDINYVNNFDGKIKIISADTKSFQPNLKELEKEITSKTKAIIINSPNNPSGVIYNENTIIKMSKILKIKEEELGSQIYLISDEPYREIIYDNAKVPFILNYYDNSFIGYSYSKSLSLPGERIGYVVVNSKIKEFKEMVASLNIANRILGFVNAPSLFQRVIKESLNLEVDSNIYKKNRDLLYNHLIQIGFECMKPEGTFYLFHKSPIDNDVKFCEDAKKFNILAVPGSTFGCPGYFRLSYCISYEKVEKSLKAFDNLMKLYKS